MVNTIKSAKVYGNIIELKVPTPAFLQYCWQYKISKGQNGNNGVDTFTAESDTLKAAWVSSGEIPNIISIGTKMVDKIAHFEVAEVIKIFKHAVNRIIPNRVIPDGRPNSFKNSAPEFANSEPMPDTLNTYKN